MALVFVVSTCTYLCFMTTGIWNYIEGIRCTVLDLNQRVVKAQENVVAIRELIRRWKDKPMFERIHEERTEPLLNIEGTFIIASHLI